MNKLGIFRDQALRYATWRGDADVLRVSPRWTRRAYWVIVAAAAAAILFAVFGTVHEYASGPAVVWLTDRIQVTATAGGTVSEIAVAAGQHVDAGQVLVRFAAPVERADLERIDREFEAQLAKSLRDPADQAARAALTTLRTQRDVAAARVDVLTIRAPKSGVIGDVRIRPGELIETGHIVLTLVGENARASVVAMVPAQYRPQLRPGTSMRFEMTGYRFAYQEMTIRSVSTQIIGPNEAKRYLGDEIGDTVTLNGPLVLVEAAPASSTFTVDGQTFSLYHGMSGVAEVRVRTESILLALIPSLRVIVGRSRA
jgi:membrane fusion protein (multidrug efflux system)